MPSALIIGASRGIGLGLTQELIGRGWSVVATCRSGRQCLVRCFHTHVLRQTHQPRRSLARPSQTSAPCRAGAVDPVCIAMADGGAFIG